MYCSRTSLNKTADLFEIAMNRHSNNVKNQFQDILAKTTIDQLASRSKVIKYSSGYSNSIVDMNGLPEIRAVNNNLEIPGMLLFRNFQWEKN